MIVTKEILDKYTTMKELLRQAEVMIPKPHPGVHDWQCEKQCIDIEKWRWKVKEVLSN